MTDKTREDFEVWHSEKYSKFWCGNKEDQFIAWQAATMKATLAERERCLKWAKLTYMPSALMHYIESGK